MEAIGQVTSERHGDCLYLEFSGTFTRESSSSTYSDCVGLIEKENSLLELAISALDIQEWDTTFLTLLSRLFNYVDRKKLNCREVRLLPGVERLIDLAHAVPAKADAREKTKSHSFFYTVGVQFLNFCDSVADILAFCGQVAIAVYNVARGRASVRWKDALLFIDESGPAALPIVTLISLLVGLILAYIGATQMAKFGAQMYVANLVGIAMAREMGPIMVSVIMAGRTGAAFAAQLGTMQVNEEIDALETFGFSSVSFLVIPRMLALILMLPILVIYANILGVVGGAVVIVNIFDISLTQFFGQTWQAVQLNDLFVGIVKAYVFAVLIALTSCMYGLGCGRSAAAVGTAVTSAVVSAIVCIVTADAILAVVFQMIGL